MINYKKVRCYLLIATVIMTAVLLTACDDNIKPLAEIIHNDERLIPISRDTSYGYKSLDNEWVIEPKFDLAGPFINGLAEVVIDNKSGFINKQGHFVIEPNFNPQLSENDESGILLVINNQGTVDVELVNYDFDKILSSKDVNYVWMNEDNVKLVYESESLETIIYDKEGTLISDVTNANPLGYYYDEHSWYFDEGLSKWGIMDIYGHIVIEPQYDAVPYKVISQGKGIAQIDGESIVVSTEEWTIPIPENYNVKSAIVDDTFVIKNNANDMYSVARIVDEDLLLSDNEYELVSHYEDGVASVKVNELWGSLDSYSNLIIEPIYDSVIVRDGYYYAKKDGVSIIFNSRGEKLIDSK